MSDKPEICKRLELASFYFEDGMCEDAIKIVEQVLPEMKNISLNRKKFREKLERELKINQKGTKA